MLELYLLNPMLEQWDVSLQFLDEFGLVALLDAFHELGDDLVGEARVVTHARTVVQCSRSPLLRQIQRHVKVLVLNADYKFIQKCARVQYAVTLNMRFRSWTAMRKGVCPCWFS